jgi:hypothetical protein
MATADEMLVWRTSSYTSNGANCVEVAWRKSSRSGNGANCVEVAVTPQAVLARDTKNTTGPTLAFSPTGWSALLTTVANHSV